MRYAGIAVVIVSGMLALAPAGAVASGFLPGAEGFEMLTRGEGGGPATQAGTHPYAITAHVRIDSGESLRSFTLGMPAGVLLNADLLNRCTAVSFHTPRSSPFEASQSGESCPDASQVGTVEMTFGGVPRRFGLFNLAPSAGLPAELGFAPFGSHLSFAVGLSPGPGGRYAFSLAGSEIPPGLNVESADIEIWGTPWGAVHDTERGDCLNEVEPDFPWAKCKVGQPRRLDPLAYATMPTDCATPLVFNATARTWQRPDPFTAAYSGDGAPLGVKGCDQLVFKPVGFGQLNDVKASSASGFVFELRNNEEGLTEPAGRIRSQIRRAVGTLPEGVTINPSLGAGLGVCTPAQYAAESPGQAPASGCPSESKIGKLTVDSPLFEDPIEGAIYLAQPGNNPFGTLLAVYLVAHSVHRGILVKTSGAIVPDPASGRLTATFEDLPQLPYARLELKFRTGQRAPLITPSACGAYTTRIEMTPWSGYGGAAVTSTDSKIESGIGGAPCPSGTPSFAPRIQAGSVNSNVGSYTPFYLHLTRTDDQQEITSYSAVLPRGITGRLAGIPFCSDAAIEVARYKSGSEETADPSCPAASQVGRTLSGYGIGSALAYAPGKVYLSGPYHGSPLSLVTIDAATVGPFDLGTIVIRSAFEVDPFTAQLRIDSRGSDPIPHIVDGIPLHLRDIRVFIDRPKFTRNPTSCEPSEVSSTLTGSGARFGDASDDSSATVSSYFQLLNCRELRFRPKLGLRLRGGSKRGDYPALRATFAARPGDANLQRIAVTMPHSEFLAQNHIRAICTKPQFAADSCPGAAAYGSAVAYTPLFDQPLRGPVYLVSSSNRLPDLVASLHSGAVHIVLAGRIGSAKGGIRTFFTDLPDAPITRFVLRLKGGNRGLLVNSSNICAAPPRATVKALGQANLGRVFNTRLRGQCGKHKHRKKSKRHGRRGAKR